MQTQVVGERLYGLDWLRIGAFALLILYHIGMYFVPWDWHVKTAEPVEWLAYPMLAINPWRLLLLFVVSGIASRVLLAKVQRPSGFAASRSSRLLLPLAAGMALFVVPQAWAELRASGAYSGTLWQFWSSEYFRFGDIDGVVLPTWNHLWFVAYLWAYSMVLALLSCAPGAARARLQRGFDRLFSGAGLFAWPAMILLGARVILHPMFGETHALVDDPYAHVVYGFAFFFGVGLAGSQQSWQAIIAGWRLAAIAAVVGFVALAAVNLAYPGDTQAPALWLFVARAGRSVQAWGAILALLGAARLYLHRDGAVRRYLTDAIFPYYIAHQTIIVLAGYWLAPLALGRSVEFGVILAATIAGCGLTYELGRRAKWLRPWIGLKSPPPRRKSVAAMPSAASA